MSGPTIAGALARVVLARLVLARLALARLALARVALARVALARLALARLAPLVGAMVVAAAGASGCAHDDLCTEATGITCVTVRVAGSIIAGTTLDRLQVDSTYSSNGSTVSHRAIVPTEAIDGGIALPAEFALTFEGLYDQLDYPSKLVVLGLDPQGMPIGVGSMDLSYPTIKQGDHVYRQLALEPADPAHSKCFARSTPICARGDSDCPLCESGRGCYSGYECASGVCLSDSSTCR